MAEQTPASESGVPPKAPPAPVQDVPAGPAGTPRSGGAWGWAFLVLCAAFVAVQVAGVLLRDRLERRSSLLAHAPPPEPPLSTEARPEAAGPAGEVASPLGPDVREVVVARPGPGAGGEPAAPAVLSPVPRAPASQPQAPAPEPPSRPAAQPSSSAAPQLQARLKTTVAVPTARPAAVAEAPAPAGPPARPAAQLPAPAATHALLVDVFLSQRYLREAEARLASLGVPHLRTEISRQGRGFRVSVAPADDAGRTAARKVLDKGGFAYRGTPAGFEVFVYYRDEAQQLGDVLAKAGVRATSDPVEGERPFWRLYAGPFPSDEARRVRKLLETKGMRTSLEARP